MRIVAGRHRGRSLAAPPGQGTRPTADRVRQALFDMLWHAPWAGRDTMDGARVLDAFAGTGALGLEALSRGAAHATFIEQDRAALAALRANVASLREAEATSVIAGDATRPPRAPAPCTLLFLDPPYGKELVPRAVAALGTAGWIAPGALVVAELGKAEPLDLPGYAPLAERAHGAARIVILRAP
ncbi:16S rRNA (guanine(966)-N(2))-methyltransferase RsmD [Falsiroseomonas oryziterrae]|uniref:16S rRNA (guanine(966)-N(2))-methyltransferase RsmD n=1 Tax=Falsiroseomonas oryziterrae TaxID=2911368 RepID=UPI001EFF7B45|nr:16S rRNA (guanine(966)-N(2))-methyltransferase RsmD [Roseomonas sp. NPKOSM-4]